MSRIDELIAEHCPDGVPYLPMGEVGEFVRGSGLQKADFAETGVPCIHYGQIYTFYGIYANETKSFVSPDLASRLKKAPPMSLLMTTTSENIEDVGKSVAWLGESEVVFGGHACAYIHNLDPMYATFIVQSRDFQTQKDRFVKGTKVKDISTKELAKIRIPVPPIAIQREISRILHDMNSLQAELQAELAARRSQYEFYRDSLLSFNDAGTPPWRWMTLNELCNVTMGEFIKKTLQDDSYDFPVYNGGATPTGYYSKSNAPEKSVVISARGSIGVVNFVLSKSWIGNSCFLVRVKDADLDNRFMYHFLKKSEPELYSRRTVGTLPALNMKPVKDFLVPVPTLDEQQRIAVILDYFDSLVNDISIGLPAEIKARRQQYEYYRDQLLSFKELAA